MLNIYRKDIDIVTAAKSIVTGKPVPRTFYAQTTVSPLGAEALKHTVTRGCAMELLERGGWRLLGKRALPLLSYGPNTMRLLHNVTGASDAGFDAKVKFRLGDEVLAYVISEHTSTVPVASALVWLSHVPDGKPPKREAYERFIKLGGDFVVEALSDDLANGLVRVEKQKSVIESSGELLANGTAQRAALEAFLTAIDAAGRRDLATFIVAALRTLLPAPGATLTYSTCNDVSLRERREAQLAAGALLYVGKRIGQWREEARALRIFDDEYDAAQKLLRAWEFDFCRVDAAIAALEGL